MHTSMPSGFISICFFHLSLHLASQYLTKVKILLPITDTFQMFSLASSSSLLLLGPILFLLFRAWLKQKKKNYPPVAGTIVHQLLNLDRLQDYMTHHSRKHKTYRMLTPFSNYIYTTDPANVEYILKSNFANYGKGEDTYEVLKDLLGDGIFAVDGAKWRQQRKVASHEFSTKVLRDYSTAVFKSNATKLTIAVLEAAESNKMIDMQDMFMKSTLDSIFKVGFGVELDTLSGSNGEGMKFAKAFDDSSTQALRRFFDVFWKIKKFFNIGLEAKMKSDIKLIDDFVYKVIDTANKNKTKERDNFMKKEDILSRFLLEREQDPENMTDQYLRDIILNFVIAGRDTSAGTLAWFFYMLCKHPDVQEKVTQEVIEATNLDEKVNVSDFVSHLTEEALNKMQYLHAALTETLRLYPAVPLDPKCCFSDDTLPDGYDVKNGDLIIYQPYSMGRMKFLWGEDAEHYRPERWLNAEGIFEQQSPFKFTAFQAGPRICLGKEFAYRQMKVSSATLLYFMKFRLWDEKKAVNYKTMLTLQVDGGLHLCAEKR